MHTRPDAPRRRLTPLLTLISMLAVSMVIAAPSAFAGTASITLVSGAGCGPSGSDDPFVSYQIGGGAAGQAEIATPNGSYASPIAASRWINTSGYAGVGDSASNTDTTYSRTFSLPAGYTTPSISIQVMADNAATVSLNGTLVGAQTQAPDVSNYQTVSTFTLSDALAFNEGTNTLTISNVDYGGPNAIDFNAAISYEMAEGTAPTITSADATAFTEGSFGTFTVTTGDPAAAIAEDGALPSGVCFLDNHDGTATLSGTPDTGTAGLSPYALSLTAANGTAPDGTQDFQLTVAPPQTPATLTLATSDAPDPVQEQNPITYTLDVGNSGSDDATGVVLADTLPASTTFNQVSTTQGSCTHTTTTVTCTLGTIGGDGSATVTLIVQAPNVTADTVITDDASVSADNAGTVNASEDTTVLVNEGGTTSGDVPPDSQAPLTFTTSTQSSNGQPAVDAGDQTAVSIIVPPGGPGGSILLDEIPCPTAPCTGAAATNSAAQPSATGKLVLGGVVYNVVPPANYPNNAPFRVTMLYDKTLHPTQGPVFYFKQGVTPTEIKLPHCGTTPPNGGKPCVLTNAKILTGPALIKGDWKVVVRINSDPRMHR